MIRKLALTLASAVLLSLSSFATTANAAPVNLAGIAKAKADTELVQVRGGRGGGGFRGGRGFGGHRAFGGGHRFHRHGHRHHGHWKRRHYVVVGGGYYGGSCAYYWNRWQATGSYHWKAKYYACVGY